MAWRKQLIAGLFLALGVSAFQVTERDNCPSGTTNLNGFQLIGGSFDVCCPGTGVTADNVVYCCVGGEKEKDKRENICIGDAVKCAQDAATSSCATAVPATAGDFSKRVASATATMTGQTSATGGVNSTSSSRSAAAGKIANAPWAAWVVVVGGAVANAALLTF